MTWRRNRKRPVRILGLPEAVPVDSRESVLRSLDEASFQAMVMEGLKERGYHVFTVPDMRRTTAGLPDLLFFHPQRPGILYAWEMKTATGRVRPDQVLTLRHFETVTRIDARVVRPKDWDTLKETV